MVNYSYIYFNDIDSNNTTNNKIITILQLIKVTIEVGTVYGWVTLVSNNQSRYVSMYFGSALIKVFIDLTNMET